MEIELRSMTMKEYNAYEDYVDTLTTDKKTTPSKRLRLCAAWILKNIYGRDVDADDFNLTPATTIEVLHQTLLKCDTVDEESLKNFVKSGNGTKQDVTNTAEPAKTEQK